MQTREPNCRLLTQSAQGREPLPLLLPSDLFAVLPAAVALTMQSTPSRLPSSPFVLLQRDGCSSASPGAHVPSTVDFLLVCLFDPLPCCPVFTAFLSLRARATPRGGWCAMSCAFQLAFCGFRHFPRFFFFFSCWSPQARAPPTHSTPSSLLIIPRSLNACVCCGLCALQVYCCTTASVASVGVYVGLCLTLSV